MDFMLSVLTINKFFKKLHALCKGILTEHIHKYVLSHPNRLTINVFSVWRENSSFLVL